MRRIVCGCLQIRPVSGSKVPRLRLTAMQAGRVKRRARRARIGDPGGPVSYQPKYAAKRSWIEGVGSMVRGKAWRSSTAPLQYHAKATSQPGQGVTGGLEGGPVGAQRHPRQNGSGPGAASRHLQGSILSLSDGDHSALEEYTKVRRRRLHTQILASCAHQHLRKQRLPEFASQVVFF